MITAFYLSKVTFWFKKSLQFKLKYSPDFERNISEIELKISSKFLKNEFYVSRGPICERIFQKAFSVNKKNVSSRVIKKAF